MTAPAQRFWIMPPAPTATDLADPTYRYLNCPNDYCCADMDQAVVAAWLLDGLRPGWHHMVGRWAADGYTVDQVRAYAPTDPTDTTAANIVVPCVTDFLRHRVAPEDVHTYLQLGVVLSGGNILDLATFRAHAETVVAFLRPHVTPMNRTTIGFAFVGDYALWAQLADGRRDLITALLAAHWDWDNLAAVLSTWNATDPAISADKIVRLHRAGITPSELAAQPGLHTASDADLAALAALRN